MSSGLPTVDPLTSEARCHDESMYDEILYEVNDPVAVITLNRPDSLNAWTDAMGGEITDAIDSAPRRTSRSSASW